MQSIKHQPNNTKEINIHELCKDESILIKEEQDYVFLHFEDIIFIEKDNKKANIHTKDRTVITALNLTDLRSKLPHYFVKTHRSYIVNMHKIRRIKPFSTTSYCIYFKNIKQTALLTKEKFKTMSFPNFD